ncbi:MAG TPA: tRNA lysidine(34) synthetase TilS [Rhabdochlamydiaceae bacterium]|nr:tRNA lysidine(34) synthetase TilS [Rhabdochlamydiaceae bacterium]
MKDSLIQSLKQFLQLHFMPGKPILLGFSGGNDSRALLDLLCQARFFFPLSIHLAHVDHGWRKESSRQAKELKKLAQTLEVSFHLHIGKEKEKSEEKARNERLLFFTRLYKELDAQALILAHHADDQAETVLKRIFEGAHLTHLGAMKKVSQYEEMIVWRPLLDIPKKKLLDLLKERQLTAIQDETNLDERYLRGKMRQRIFPELNRQFGKEITGNLVRLSETSHQLHAYLQVKTSHFFSKVEEGPSDIRLDFKNFFPLEKLEAHFVIKKLLSDQKVMISRVSIELMIIHLEKKSVKRKFGKNLIVDRGILFLLKGTVTNNFLSQLK